MVKYILYILMALAMVACSHRPTDLERALSFAGNNRTELEKVLHHYSQRPEDSLKYRAACFLIENMLYYHYYEGKLLDDYTGYYEALSKRGKNPNAVLDSFVNRFGQFSLYQLDVKRDIFEIDSAYLVNNIEWSFKVWQEQPWGKNVSFDTFCEYVLPYRLGDEKLTGWREDFYKTYSPFLRHLTSDDPIDAARTLIDSLRRGSKVYTMIGPTGFPRIGPYASKCMTGSCQNLSDFAVYACRAVGIPCTIDFLPLWGDANVGHAWVAYWDKKGELYTQDFLGEVLLARNNAIRASGKAKTYRYTFSLNRQYYDELNASSTSRPPSFRFPRYIDVTPYYSDCLKEQLTIPDSMLDLKKGNGDIVYLCMLNRKEWEPVDWTIRDGKAVQYRNVHKGSTILAIATWEDKKLIYQSDPFLLRCPLGIRIFSKDGENTQEVTLFSKFNPGNDLLFLKRMANGVFEGSNTPDFSQRDTLYHIKNCPGRLLIKVNVTNEKKYRYVRYYGPSNGFCNIAEVAFYEKDQNEPLKGKVMGTPGCYQGDGSHEYTNVFDGNTETSFDHMKAHGGWAGLDLGEPKAISQIIFTPRNLDNYVRPGDTYELFYCDKEWISLGTKTATSDSLAYSNVPVGALLYLQNHSRGVQERIFTYEDGRQVWW